MDKGKIPLSIAADKKIMIQVTDIYLSPSILIYH